MGRLGEIGCSVASLVVRRGAAAEEEHPDEEERERARHGGGDDYCRTDEGDAEPQGLAHPAPVPRDDPGHRDRDEGAAKDLGRGTHSSERLRPTDLLGEQGANRDTARHAHSTEDLGSDQRADDLALQGCPVNLGDGEAHCRLLLHTRLRRGGGR